VNRGVPAVVASDSPRDSWREALVLPEGDRPIGILINTADAGPLVLFHLDSHPVAVARLTRFLVQHDVPFVLHEAFTVDDDDQIVFESDTGRPVRREGVADRRSRASW
jgi:hypothetical protein